MPTNSKGILTNMDEKINNGIVGLRPGTYAIIVDGRQVDTAHGDPLAAEAQRAEWLEAMADDPAVEAYANVPLDQIPATYWKNGHIPPLRFCVVCGQPATIADDHGWMCDGCYNGTQEPDDFIPFDGRPMDDPERQSDWRNPYGLVMYTVEDAILAEYAICPECASSYLVVEPTVSRHWRGWQVYCGDCDSLLVEIDPPEAPVDPRSL